MRQKSSGGTRHNRKTDNRPEKALRSGLHGRGGPTILEESASGTATGKRLRWTLPLPLLKIGFR